MSYLIMSKNSYINKKVRLDRLIGLLKSQDFWTAKELSNQLNVSQRTLMRDIKLVQEIGIPIDTSIGRGGGFRIDGRFGISRLNLNHKEIIDLLLATATIERFPSPIFLQDMASIRDKIANVFPPAQRLKIQNLRKRLYIGETASVDVLKSYSSMIKIKMDHVHEAFFNQNLLSITYRSERKEKLTRTIEPHYLVLNWPVWYILAWDQLRDDMRCFRIDRILAIKSQQEKFNLHHQARFERYLKEFSKSI